MLDALITYGSVAAGLYVGWRMFRRSIRAVWARFMSSESAPITSASRHLIGASAGAALQMPPQQHQAKPELVLDPPTIKAYLKRHNMSDEDLVDILALLRRSNGENLISANKIRDITGGNEATVKARVAALRPKPPAPKPTPSIRRPQNGW